MWTIISIFVGVYSENGDWSAVSYDTEEEANSWWNAVPGVATYDIIQTMEDPDGLIVASRLLPRGTRK